MQHRKPNAARSRVLRNTTYGAFALSPVTRLNRTRRKSAWSPYMNLTVLWCLGSVAMKHAWVSFTSFANKVSRKVVIPITRYSVNRLWIMFTLSH